VYTPTDRLARRPSYGGLRRGTLASQFPISKARAPSD